MKTLRPSLALLALWSAACPSRSGGAGLRPAQSYAQSASWAPPAAERAAYEAASHAAPASTLAPDPALAAVAAELARRVARDPQARTPSVRVIQAVSWMAGVTDPLPVVLTVKGAAGHTDAEVERGLREILQTEAATHIGVGRAAAGSDEVVVVAVTRRRVRLDAVPRAVHVGGRVALRGQLAEGLSSPAMVVTHPDGHTEETPLGAEAQFLGQFRATARGVYQVEISAESDAGSTVVANFPVYADAEAPEAPEETGAADAEDPALAEAALLRFVNEARQRARVPPLEAMAPLAEAARAHSRDMAEHHYVAHNSLSGATPGQRLREAGLLSGLSLENVARGYGAREIHDGLMVSPGHRANLLNPRVTHVGIGVVREPGPSGALLVTQDFIEVASAIDPAATVTRLLEAVNRERRARGAPPLQQRPTLQAAAERAARVFFEDPRRTQPQALEEATNALRSEGLLFRRIEVTGAFGPHAEESTTLAPLYNAATTAIGIGVAQGDRADAPPHSVFVVYVLAVPR